MTAAFQAAAVIALDAQFRAAGEAGQWCPASGPEIPLVFLRNWLSGDLDVVGNRMAGNGQTWEVRRADVPAPLRGDQLAVDGVTYTIQSPPRLVADGLVWLLDCVEGG